MLLSNSTVKKPRETGAEYLGGPMFCAAKTAKNLPCRCRAISGSAFCFFHSPDKQEQRHEAQRNGGLAKKSIPPLPDAPPREYDVRNPKDIVEVFNRTLNGILNGRIEPRQGYIVVYLLESSAARGSLGRAR